MASGRDDYVKSLENANEDLRHRLREMERVFGMREVVPIAFQLTPVERRILSLLISRQISSKAQILIAVDDGRGRALEPNIVGVMICKLRKKLRPFEVFVQTAWGHGYYMEADSKRRIKDHLMLETEAA